MPQFNSIELINDQKEIDSLLLKLHELQTFDSEVLNTPPEEGKWSIAQVLEHLNTYNRFYIPAITQAIESNTAPKFIHTFKSGLLGDYFTKMMQPDANNKVKNKTKAAKNHSPSAVLNTTEVIRYFEESELQLKALLDKAKRVDMGRIKVTISITNLIKLKLGDTFRFLIAHQMRHFVQIGEVVEALTTKEQKVSNHGQASL